MEIKRIIKDILIENKEISPKNLKERNFDINALMNKKADKINTFTGFRRVGKTYLLFLIMKNIRDETCVYFNFEDERIPESTEVLTQLLYAVEELYPDKPRFFFLMKFMLFRIGENFLEELWIRDIKFLLQAQVQN